MLVVRRGATRGPEKIAQEIDQLYRVLLTARPRVMTRGGSQWRPPVDVYETDQLLVIVAELAGVEESTLEITIEHDVLMITGRRTEVVLPNTRRYRESGIAYGPCTAQVMLPFPIEIDRSEAEFHNGMLKIVMPKLSPRTIHPNSSHGCRTRGEHDGREEKEKEGRG